MADERMIMLDLPDYKGPDRRGDGKIVVTQCQCHPKHERVLQDHDKKFNDLEGRITVIEQLRERRRREVDQHIDESHKEMWGDIKKLNEAKVPNKLFYLFISTFSVLFIGGIITVYTGMHEIDKGLGKSIADLKVEVKVVDVKVSNHVTTATRIEKEVDQLHKKVDQHIYQTSNGHMKHLPKSAGEDNDR